QERESSGAKNKKWQRVAELERAESAHADVECERDPPEQKGPAENGTVFKNDTDPFVFREQKRRMPHEKGRAPVCADAEPPTSEGRKGCARDRFGKSAENALGQSTDDAPLFHFGRFGETLGQSTDAFAEDRQVTDDPQKKGDDEQIAAEFCDEVRPN